MPARRTTLAATAVLGVLAISQQPAQAAQDEPEPARPSLITESASLVAGATNHIAVAFEIDIGWHTYWPGQNDTGFAPTVELTLPDGWTAGEPQWPAPHRHVSPGDILDHIYEGTQSTIIIPVTIPPGAAKGPATITAELEWLVCREACIPGWTTLSLDTSVLPQTARPRPSEHAPRFRAARDRIPEPFPTGQGDRPNDANAQAQNAAAPIAMIWEDEHTLVLSPRPRSPLRATNTLAGRSKLAAIAFYPAESGAPIADLLRSGESRSNTPSAPPAPLRLTRDKSAKPIRGIIELMFAKGPPLLYSIETSPPEPTKPIPTD